MQFEALGAQEVGLDGRLWLCQGFSREHENAEILNCPITG